MLITSGNPTAEPGRPRQQSRRTLMLAAATAAATAAVGLLVGLSLQQWLVLGLGLCLVVWVGGAVSGQILLARLLDRASSREAVEYLRLLLWIIPRVYVPVGLVGVGCGIALVAVSGTSFAQPAVVVPLALYGLTAVAGSVFSAPGYVRLIRLADTHGPDDPRVLRRLMPLAWLNRVELALVCGVGFVLVASLA